MYAKGDYDLAGFSVGAVERDQALTGAGVQAGDVVLGLASSGVHSNGFSLVRRLVEQSGLSYGDAAPWDSSMSLGEALLTPTRIYVKSTLAAVRAGTVRALAHITGGGLIENIPRVLPVGLGVTLDATQWPLLPVFGWLAKAGGLSHTDLARTFNCGLGMVVVCPPEKADEAARLLREHGETVYRVGTIGPVTDGERVTVAGTETAWRA
jgi:phosphoribosylformylglycinamidine cyclo-ligase